MHNFVFAYLYISFRFVSVTKDPHFCTDHYSCSYGLRSDWRRTQRHPYYKAAHARQGEITSRSALLIQDVLLIELIFLQDAHVKGMRESCWWWVPWNGKTELDLPCKAVLITGLFYAKCVLLEKVFENKSVFAAKKQNNINRVFTVSYNEPTPSLPAQKCHSTFPTKLHFMSSRLSAHRLLQFSPYFKRKKDTLTPASKRVKGFRLYRTNFMCSAYSDR